MTDVVAPETPHYVPAPETQADGELTELNTRVLFSLIFLSLQWTMPTFLSLTYPRLPPQKIAWLLHIKHARRCRTTAFSMLLITGSRLHRPVDLFCLLLNNCLSLLKTERMFDIADIPFARVSEEEKKIYAARMKETGSYQGYKPRQYWVKPKKLFAVIKPS